MKRRFRVFAKVLGGIAGVVFVVQRVYFPLALHLAFLSKLQSLGFLA